MLHELCMMLNSFGGFIIVMALIYGFIVLAKAYIERNKPVLECECECCEPEEEDEEEIVAMGGEEEDHEPR